MSEQVLLRTSAINCGRCQYTPTLSLLEQIWPDYDGDDPNPYLYRRGRATRIIYRNGFINNQRVSYGPPIYR